jgi:hypothetical protein
MDRLSPPDKMVGMDTGDLHRPLYCADILVNALNQDPTRPLLHLLDGPTLTVGEVRDAVSRFAQALRSLDVKAGTRVGLLAANRPEVLHTRLVPSAEDGRVHRCDSPDRRRETGQEGPACAVPTTE